MYINFRHVLLALWIVVVLLALFDFTLAVARYVPLSQKAPVTQTVTQSRP
jgi:beta-lactamase regulating signal transducer with metallopeptidase domain